MRLIQSPVRRSRKYETTLQRIGAGDEKLFPTLREALSFCAVLGYKERRREPLDTSGGLEDIAGAQYQTNEAVDIVFALALAESKTSDILKEERERDCIQIYEEYANGGLGLVQGWLERHPDIGVEDAIWRGLKSIGTSSPAQAGGSEVVAPSF